MPYYILLPENAKARIVNQSIRNGIIPMADTKISRLTSFLLIL